jgi:TolB protein
MLRLQTLISVAALAALMHPQALHAQQGRTVIDSSTKAKRGLYPIAIPLPADSDEITAKTLQQVMSFDLGVSSWFKVLDPRSFLADLGAEGLSIEPQKWKDVGAFGVVKAAATLSGGKVKVVFKLYEVDKGAVPVLEREYSGTSADTRRLAHRFCNDVVKYYTGEDGFFGAPIVFSAKKKKGAAIMAVDFDGESPRAVTKNDSINILPAFSRSGGQIAFTSYMRGTADLYVVSGGARPKRLAQYDGMNTGAAFSPDGSKIAITLSKDQNPEIYLLSAKDGSVIKRLTNNRYIDTSPAWSADGSEIAFVSNREGSPQIFVMKADGSGATRVSTASGQSQTPAWNPKAGTRQIAYTIRDDATGRFDIVVQDLAANKLVRVTQNQGDNEEPAWSPNGRVLVFASNRSGGAGLYLANADGTGEQRLIYKGSVTSPDWGPVSAP